MKKVKKIRNYNVGYKKYSQQFAELRKARNVKQGVRKFTKKTYNKLRSQGFSNKEILEEQMFLSESKQAEIWQKYLKIRENIKPGESTIYDSSYWGQNEDETEGLGYHRTMTGLMRDKDAFHFMITNDILNSGLDREEVLAQYGY